MAGIDWRSVFGNISGPVEAAAIVAALVPIIGSRPSVVTSGNTYRITFTPEQEDRLTAWTIMQIDSEPGPVSVDLGGAALKVVTRKYWPYAAGAVALGVVLGYSMKRGRK